jgi:hypothetical protein
VRTPKQTLIEIIHTAVDRIELCEDDSEVQSVLNTLWRRAFERGKQHMAKIMREGGHVIYDYKKAQP